MQTYDMKKSGERIQDLRKAFNLSQVNAAELIGISTNSLSRIERGERGCSVDTLIAMSTLFHTSIDYLVLGETKYPSHMKNQLEGVIKQLSAIRASLNSTRWVE